MIPAVIFGALGWMLACTYGLILMMADGPVFTRQAFAEVRVMAARALSGSHRADRTPLRERARARARNWWSRPERLADLSEPLPYETTTAPCLACTDEDDGPCRCTDDCGHIRCTGERQS